MSRQQRRKMNTGTKRILAVVLAFALILGLVPFWGTLTATATDYRSMYVGTGGVKTGDFLQLATERWRVLSEHANGSVPGNGKVLFVKETDSGALVAFDDSNVSIWSFSKAKKDGEQKYQGFSEEIRNLILPTTKGITAGEKKYSTSSSLNGEHLFFLSAEELMEGEYKSSGMDGEFTRSGYADAGNHNLVYVNTPENGMVAQSVDITARRYYAMNVAASPSGILFTKSAGLSSSISKNGNLQSNGTLVPNRVSEWTPVLLSKDLGITVSNATVTAEGSNYKIDFSYTVTGTTGTSLLWTEGSYNRETSTVKYYAKYTGDAGTCTFQVPQSFDAKKEHLYVLAEKSVSADSVDYVSVPVEIDMSNAGSYTIYGQTQTIQIENDGTITTIENVGGSVTPEVQVKAGEDAVLTATPFSGYEFVGWRKKTDAEGTYCSDMSSYTVPAVSAEETYIAVFQKAYYRIQTAAAPTEGGFVSGGGQVQAGASVTLLATPEQQYVFDGWYRAGDASRVSSSPSLTITNVSGDTNYVAKFKKTKYTLTLAVFPTGAARALLSTKAPTQDAGSPVGDSSVHTIETENPNEVYYTYIALPVDSPYEVVKELVDGTTGKTKYNVFSTTYNSLKKDGMNWNATAPDDGLKVQTCDGKSYFIRAALKDNKEKDYTNGVVTAVSPVGAGVTSGDEQSNTTVNATLRATPREGYVFDHWEWYENGQKYTNEANPFQVSVNGYYVYTAVFRKATFEIKGEVSPIEGGTFTGSGTYEYGSEAVLTATPKENYKFSKWTWTDAETGKKQESTDAELHIEEVKSSNTYTAEFEKENYTLTVSTYATDGKQIGKARISSSGKSVETDAAIPRVSMNIPEKGNASLLATVDDMEYRFVHWVSNDGAVSADNPLSVTNITQDREFTAVFERTSYQVTLQTSPVQGGSALLEEENGKQHSEGVIRIEAGKNVVLRATPAAEYEFYRWEGSDGTVYTEREVTISQLRGDVTYKAVFVPGEITLTFYIRPEFGGNPIGSLEDGNGTSIVSGTQITLSAKSSYTVTAKGNGQNYKFAYWEDGSGTRYTGAQLQLNGIIADETYTAVFAKPEYTITTIASPMEGGTVTGGGEFPLGGATTLEAQPAAGFEFERWESSDGSISYQNIVGLNNIQANATYTAYFVKKNPKITINWSPSDKATEASYIIDGDSSKTGTISNGGTIPASMVTTSSSIVIRLNTENGWKVARWTKDDGTAVNDEILKLVNVKQDVTYFAQLEEGTYRISMKSSPIEGGVTEGKITSSASYAAAPLVVTPGTGVTLQATPNSGYMVDYWTSSDGIKSYGTTGANGENTLVIQNVYGDETYTAHYIKKEVMVTAEATPGQVGNKVVYKIPGGMAAPTTEGESIQVEHHPVKTTFTLTASPGASYEFKQWILSDNTTSTANPLTVSNITEDMHFIAEFTAKGYTIQVKGAPIDGGLVNAKDVSSGATGSSITVAPGHSVELVAQPGTGYQFDYWSCDDGTTASGVTDDTTGENKLTLNEVFGSAVYTAHFIKKEVDVTVTVSASYGTGLLTYMLEPGMGGEQPLGTAGNGGTIQVPSGATLMVWAKEASGKKFKEWVKQDGTVISTNPMILSNVKESATYAAIYEPLVEDKNIKVIASPASGGRITKEDTGLTSVKITATANPGYRFQYWKRKGVDGILTSNASYVVNQIHTEDTYIAYFEVDPNYHAKSGITDENFLNTRRLFEAPVYQYNHAYVQELARRAVQQDSRRYQNQLPSKAGETAIGALRQTLQERERMGQGIYDEQLIASYELITSNQEIMTIRVMQDVELYQEEAAAMVADKFGERYSCEVLRVISVNTLPEWKDGVRTYLWSHTGALAKDTVYIICETDTNKAKMVAAVADENGVLRFTYPAIGNTTRMIAVRIQFSK